MELARSFARWLQACRTDVAKRRRLIIGGGNRGSGKTWFLAGVVLVAVALEWPGIVADGGQSHRQAATGVSQVHRRGPAAGIEWIERDVADFRDMRTEFLTGSTVQWLSGRSANTMRQAGLPIRHVFINEGQDQPEAVFINGISAIRNTGGLVSIATNPPRSEQGDWTAALWSAIEAEEINGERFFVDNKLNRAVDQDALPDIAAMIRVVNREAAEADADGIFHLSGTMAYPAFSPLPVAKNGHVGEPPQLGYKDVTRKLTAEAVGGDFGYDYICGCDWQNRPGVLGAIIKIYEDARGELLLYAADVIGVRGVEPDFSQALFAAGFVPTHGMKGVPLLLVGDATGARQNAEHKWALPPSFTAMKSDGWIVIPPMYHWKNRTPLNPLVRESRAQMHQLFDRRQIILSKKCTEPADGFAPLTESFRRAKVGPRGGLIEKGGYQHGPDTVRYVAWRFMPRPRPQTKPVDATTIEAFAGIRVTQS